MKLRPRSRRVRGALSRTRLTAALVLTGTLLSALVLGTDARSSVEAAVAQPGMPPAEAVPITGTGVSLIFAGLARDGDPPPSRVPASPEGLRIWSDGDSVSYFMTTNLFNTMSSLGAVPVRAADYKISARLADPSGYSAVLGVPYSWWLTYLPAEVALYSPDVVVLMVGANDAVFVSPALYGQRAAETMDLFASGGPLLVWVGIPSLLRPDLAANAPALNEAARTEAESRDWVVFVDTSDVTPDGADGVHFGPVRASLLADAVVEALFPGRGSDPNGGAR